MKHTSNNQTKKQLTENYFAADWKTNILQPNSQKSKEIKPKPKMKQHTQKHTDTHTHNGFVTLAIRKWDWWKEFLRPSILSMAVEVIIYLPKRSIRNRCLFLPGMIFPFLCCLILWKPMVWRFPDQRMKCWINIRFILGLSPTVCSVHILFTVMP